MDGGTYSDDPLRRFLQEDPWGVSPLPFLEGEPWEFVKCRACSQAYHKWLLTPEWQEKRFSEWMSEEAILEFTRRYGKTAFSDRFQKGLSYVEHALRLEQLTRSLRGDKAPRLLDFGCGFGEFLVVTSTLAFEAFGIDRSPERQRVLERKDVTTYPDLDTAQHAQPGGFHCVTLFQVLEHLDDPLPVLKAIRQLMPRGGVLVIEVPNCTGVTAIRTRADYAAIHPLEHINCFTPESLRRFAERAGFRSIATPVVQVTGSVKKVFKNEAKRLANPFRPPTTNQYFRSV